jgi:hypothetical protein
VRTHERSELCQLQHFYQDLKDRYVELIERGEIDAARELLERRLLPLRRILLHEEWNVN